MKHFNIPHDFGLEAVKYWLEKYPEIKKHRFSNNFVLEAIKLILENNTFCFNNDFYKQIKGTATGTKFAPIYATLTIGYLEVKLDEKLTEVFGDEFGNYFVTNWKRFLDDCFIPWTKTVSDLESLHNILNNLHIDIKFTLQFSNTEQSFLDILVKNRDGKIETDIYYKDTESKQYLLFYSCHPIHTKINIPYNLARRLRTIVSEEQIFQRRMQELKTFLIKQNYPTQIIEHSVQKAMSLDKNVLRTVTVKGKENIVPYVSPFNPRDPEMFRVIMDNMPILQANEKMRNILSNYKIKKSKRQPYNLKRLLTKAKFTSNDTCEVRKCTRPNCGLCIHLVEGNSFKFNCGINFKVYENVTCEVKNVIYKMKCRGCG